MIDLKEYTEFVKALTSAESEYFDDFINRLCELDDEGINVSLLWTGTGGMCAESGELYEVVKKMVFQRGPYDAFHMLRELGDIFFYWVDTCRALGVTPEEVIRENISKLKSRYPDGEFSEFFSNNRKAGDL